jgi:hypothetical protein
MYVHTCAKWNVASAEIEGDVGDELEHWNEEENDVEEEIVVVWAGRSKDDVGMDIRNHSP